jgi:hypothetical protein
MLWGSEVGTYLNNPFYSTTRHFSYSNCIKKVVQGVDSGRLHHDPHNSIAETDTYR